MASVKVHRGPGNVRDSAGAKTGTYEIAEDGFTFTFTPIDGPTKVFHWHLERDAYFLVEDEEFFETRVEFTCLQSDMDGCIRWGWIEKRKHIWEFHWTLSEEGSCEYVP